MYNAMLRKGYDDTPEDAVESMVAVHNFLNEGAWTEIEGWEARFSKGLGYGWQACSRGEEGFQAMPQWKGDRPRLLRFMGRPGDLTPKARMMEMLGMVWPSKFAYVSLSSVRGFVSDSAGVGASRRSIAMIGMCKGQRRKGRRGKSDM